MTTSAGICSTLDRRYHQDKDEMIAELAKPPGAPG